MNDSGNSKVGTISLRASIAGIVVPVLVAFLVLIFAKRNPSPYFTLCAVLFAGLELVALVTGAIARREPSGRAGLVISALCIIVTGGAAFFFSGSPAPPEQETPVADIEQPQPDSYFRKAADTLPENGHSDEDERR